MKTSLLAFALGAMLAAVSVAANAGTLQENYTYVPPGGYVATKEMAIAIALIVATPVYGKKLLDGEKPFTAVLKDGVWIVTGYLPSNMKGGTLEVHISKQTGQIVRMLHWK